MSNQFKYGDTIISIGDVVQVSYRLIEKEIVAGRAKREKKEQIRERTQVFEGTLIKIRGEAENKSITVRRLASGNIGIERIFPVSSQWIKSISVKKKNPARRAKLYYLRKQTTLQASH